LDTSLKLPLLISPIQPTPTLPPHILKALEAKSEIPNPDEARENWVTTREKFEIKGTLGSKKGEIVVEVRSSLH
jgi:hypothetical protein